MNVAEDNIQLERKGKFRVNDKCGYSTANFRGFYDKRKLCTALSICWRNVNKINKNVTINLDAQYFYVLYNASMCFDHVSQPSSGSYKFDQCVQCIRQLVIDDTHKHTHTHTHTQTPTIKNTMMTAVI